MGRPREFDEHDVLLNATALLGRRGFDALSVDTLLAALGLNRASFYKLYGSKHGLARAALDQVCRRAQDGDIDDSSLDLVVVALLELAHVSGDLKALTCRAVDLCFAGDPRTIGQHLLTRADRPPT